MICVPGPKYRIIPVLFEMFSDIVLIKHYGKAFCGGGRRCRQRDNEREKLGYWMVSNPYCTNTRKKSCLPQFIDWEKLLFLCSIYFAEIA